MTLIDLRSDSVTKPNRAMRMAMCDAEVGDDVFGDDPTVNQLQSKLAEMAGKEAGLFLPSGTQSNLVGLMAHCGRGDEYIVGQKAHTYKYEGGGAAVLASIQPQPLTQNADGTLDLEQVEAFVKPDDAHHARTRLLSLENTWFGNLMPLNYPAKARALANRYNLGLHLDGARIFNAVVKQNVPLDRMVAAYDTISVCLSKGLGAPVGSVLLGSRTLIKKAHRWRKVVGGGMRQAGILAAAGIYALDHQVARLADDHAHAEQLAEDLANIDGITIDPVQTNMVFLTQPGIDLAHQRAFMAERGILLSDTNPLRLVTHLDITAAHIPTIIAAFKDYFRQV